MKTERIEVYYNGLYFLDEGQFEDLRQNITKIYLQYFSNKRTMHLFKKLRCALSKDMDRRKEIFTYYHSKLFYYPLHITLQKTMFYAKVNEP